MHFATGSASKVRRTVLGGTKARFRHPTRFPECPFGRQQPTLRVRAPIAFFDSRHGLSHGNASGIARRGEARRSDFCLILRSRFRLGTSASRESTCLAGSPIGCLDYCTNLNATCTDSSVGIIVALRSAISLSFASANSTTIADGRRE